MMVQNVNIMRKNSVKIAIKNILIFLFFLTIIHLLQTSVLASCTTQCNNSSNPPGYPWDCGQTTDSGTCGSAPYQKYTFCQNKCDSADCPGATCGSCATWSCATCPDCEHCDDCATCLDCDHCTGLACSACQDCPHCSDCDHCCGDWSDWSCSASCGCNYEIRTRGCPYAYNWCSQSACQTNYSCTAGCVTPTPTRTPTPTNTPTPTPTPYCSGIWDYNCGADNSVFKCQLPIPTDYPQTWDNHGCCWPYPTPGYCLGYEGKRHLTIQYAYGDNYCDAYVTDSGCVTEPTPGTPGCPPGPYGEPPPDGCTWFDAPAPPADCYGGSCTSACNMTRTRLLYCSGIHCADQCGIIDTCSSVTPPVGLECGGGPTNTPTPTTVVTNTPTSTPTPTFTPTPTITPTPLPCTVSGMSPQSGCFGPTNQPGFSATYGGGADRIQFAVDNNVLDPENCNNPFTASWNCNSDWIASTTYGYPSCSLGTGGFYWSARAASSTSVCSTSCLIPQYSFSVDVSAPDTPDVSTNGSSICDPISRDITFSWDPSTDQGCLACSGYADKYWLQGLNLDTVVYFINNGEWSPSSCSSPSYSIDHDTVCTAPGETIQLNVRQAKDSYALVGNLNSDNESDENPASIIQYECTGVCGPSYTPTPTPTEAYPTIHLQGNLREYSGTSCANGIAATTVDVSLLSGVGITSSCTASQPYQTYACDIVFDKSNPLLTPAQNFSLSATTDASYSPIYSATSGSCTVPTDPTPTLYFDAENPSNQTRDIIFSLAETSWFKMRDTSYSRAGAVTNSLPQNVNPFDSDDPGNRYLIENSAGNDQGVAAGTSFSLGGETEDIVSAKKWSTTSYAPLKPLFSSQFLSYIKSRKEYTTAASAGELEADRTHINIISGLTIDSSTATTILGKITDPASMVVVVDGDLTINQGEDNDNRFNKAKKAIAFVVKGNINIVKDMTEVNGVFIGDNIDVSLGAQVRTDDYLKITGNLISGETASGIPLRQRSDDDNSRPSFFVIFDPGMYIKLLPYLSVRSYELNIE